MLSDNKITIKSKVKSNSYFIVENSCPETNIFQDNDPEIIPTKGTSVAKKKQTENADFGEKNHPVLPEVRNIT